MSCAGFRSRTKYIDVLDPTNMCNYISEVLDPGRDGPLFMVIESFVLVWNVLHNSRHTQITHLNLVCLLYTMSKIRYLGWTRAEYLLGSFSLIIELFFRSPWSIVQVKYLSMYQQPIVGKWFRKD